MARLADLVSEADVVALVDPGVLRDMASSLTGLWQPGDESDDERRAELCAAARLRLYADSDRGWLLLTTQQARDGVDKREDADWTAGFVPAVESFDDGAIPAEIDSLARLYHDDEGLDGEAARTLAVAVLCTDVRYLVTRSPSAFRHQREHDLPERLEIIDAVEAVNHVHIAPGEPPTVGPLPGSLLAEGEPWWVP
jgi:hypothetical protein